MRFFIFAIIICLLYFILKGWLRSGRRVDAAPRGGVIDEMVQDPYCKVYAPAKDSLRRVLGGEEYFFCSQKCADLFEAERKK
jgi:YHS domain-containing protein